MCQRCPQQHQQVRRFPEGLGSVLAIEMSMAEVACRSPDASALYAGDWAPRGPKVHGRKYLKLEELNGTWVALVSDEQLDTLNAELLVLHESTAARTAAEGLHKDATVSPSPQHRSGCQCLACLQGCRD